ncbi:MAG: DUF2281 domain-containing protein [Oscillospiraceae bacterium]|nr:DUF2281 domain-containing protein [Oscillospiraceae bacterium]
MLQTFEGYWDNGRILPFGAPIRIAGRPKVLITVLENEPVKPVPEKRKTRYIIEPDPSKSPELGCWKGLAVVPDDFGAPLDEMKEYMF